VLEVGKSNTHTHTLLFIHLLTLPLQHKILLRSGQQERCTAAKHYSNSVQYSEFRTIILGSLGRKADSASHVVQRARMCSVSYKTTVLAIIRLGYL